MRNFCVVKGKGSSSKYDGMDLSSLFSNLGSKFSDENVLKWTKDFQAAYMGILAVHMVCDDDDLQDICVHWPTVDDFVSTTRR